MLVYLSDVLRSAFTDMIVLVLTNFRDGEYRAAPWATSYKDVHHHDGKGVP